MCLVGRWALLNQSIDKLIHMKLCKISVANCWVWVEAAIARSSDVGESCIVLRRGCERSMTCWRWQHHHERHQMNTTDERHRSIHLSQSNISMWETPQNTASSVPPPGWLHLARSHANITVPNDRLLFDRLINLQLHYNINAIDTRHCVCVFSSLACGPTQPSIPPGSVNEDQLRLEKKRQVWFIPLADDCGVCR